MHAYELAPFSYMELIYNVNIVQIGLAVGDTQAEIEKAKLTRIAIQVRFSQLP